jgi:hypothetical protein
VLKCAYTLLVLNYMSHAPLPNHYTSPRTKRPSVPGLCCHESTLLHHTNNVPLGQSCEQDVKDVATSKDFYVISCLSSSLDSKVKAYLYNNTAKNNYKALRATVYNV